MGHQDIAKSLATRKWRAVIAKIADGASVEAIASATTEAAEASLKAYSNDRTVRRAFFLLARVPVAARQSKFSTELRALGLAVDDAPNLITICAAIMQAIDGSDSTRSDLGEMAALSAVESLQAVAGRSLVDLFGSHIGSTDETQKALAGLATVKQFGVLARDFLARLVRHHLDYYLSRELPNHVGTARRFASVREHMEFEEAVELHCREAANVIVRFAGQWHSKANFEGGISEEKAGAFAFHAFEKLREELRSRRGSVA
jgi:hypothetical protein